MNFHSNPLTEFVELSEGVEQKLNYNQIICEVEDALPISED